MIRLPIPFLPFEALTSPKMAQNDTNRSSFSAAEAHETRSLNDSAAPTTAGMSSRTPLPCSCKAWRRKGKGESNRLAVIEEPDGSTVDLPFTELTGDLLKGTFADDPRWIWFADHSKSPAAPCGAELLAKFGLTNAEPLHLSETDALRFIRDGRWDGIGLDPKFMAEAARLCDHLLPAARATNCSNILIRETDGTITGDFTIGTGLLKMLPAMGLAICQTRALFLTEEALEPLAAGLARLLTALGAPQAKVIRIDHPLSADAAKRIEGAEGFSLLFNATNLGRAPNTDQMPIESAEVFQCFPKLKAVLDSVDEPVRPRLIWEAQQRGLEARTTLGLRVVVAREAMELFAGRTLPLCATRSILCDIRREASNIVLIGMPGCGKTTIGKCVAARLLRPFIDLDALVERRVGKSSERIYREDGEEYFRDFESEIIKELSGRHGLVISTGGGACLRPENRMRLALNGTFYWLQRPLDHLSTYQRPLSQARGVEALYEERSPIFEKIAERIIEVQSVEDTAAALIGETVCKPC